VNPQVAIILLLLVLLLGAVAIGACMFLFQRYMNPEPSPLEERLKRLRGYQAEELAKGAAGGEKSSRYYQRLQYRNEALGNWLEQFPQFHAFKLRLMQADIKTLPDLFLLRNVLLPCILGPVLGSMFHFVPLILLGPLAGLGGFAMVELKRMQRYQKFIVQLPDGLMLMTSALRAGHSLQSALSVASAELADPIGAEFQVLVRDINLGLPVKEALSRLVTKMDCMPDICMFSTAVVIQREAGGNLAEVLETLGNTIRERFKLKRQISALTGQARITGYVMGGAPIGVLLLLTLFMYSYVKPLYETDMGHIALLVAFFLQVIGFFVMKKIIDIRI
jgi:tight adherence protein B